MADSLTGHLAAPSSPVPELRFLRVHETIEPVAGIPDSQHVAPDQLIKAVPLLADARPATLRRIAKAARIIDVERGHALYGPGKSASGVYSIVLGRVKLALVSCHHEERVIGLPGPGDIFGHVAAILRQPQMLSAETLSPSKLIHVEPDVLSDALKRDADLARRMLQALAAQFRDAVQALAHVGSGPERTIDFILERIPADARGSAAFNFPARKRYIASLLNLTPEHFSRVLHELCAAQLVTIQGLKVCILNVQQLKNHRETLGCGATELRCNPRVRPSTYRKATG